jgi:hypothetical protein
MKTSKFPTTKETETDDCQIPGTMFVGKNKDNRKY